MLEELFETALGAYEVTLEPWGNYNRIMLSPLLSGERTYEEVVTYDAAWYAEERVTIHFGDAVTRIDRARKVIAARPGETSYNELLIATGSSPFFIPVPGKDLPSVMTYRDLDDTEAMIEAASIPGARAVVIGGGLRGL
ncbi:MAG: FAD-dependent oxidoreductase [Pseudomonadota bacterium]